VVDFVKDMVLYLEQGVHFVLNIVEKGIEFILSIGDKIFQFLLDGLLIAFKALNFLFKLVGIDLTVILKWIGSLFGWDKIWDTHKYIAKALTNAVSYGVDWAGTHLDQYANYINDQLSNFKNQLKNIILPDSAKTQVPMTEGNQVSTNNPDANMNKPSSNYMFYHMEHSSLADSGCTNI
jgi:hypothetical protein